MRYKYGRHSEISRRELAFIGIAAAAVVLSALAVFYGGQGNGEAPSTETAGVEELSTKGFVPVKPLADVVEGRGLITLEGDCYRLTAGTDQGQAESIKDGLQGITGPRPNTHEPMRDVFEALDIEVLMVKVTELRDGNFFGKIILQQGDTVLSLDSKPSDGIALAIRTGKTIYFNETLLKERGQKIC